MHQCLGMTAGLPLISAQALFSGTRIREAMSLIKRLADTNADPLDPWLAKAFGHIGEITTARDRILHHGLEIGQDIAVVTDAHRNLPGKSFRMEFSVVDLDNLESDVLTALSCLNMFRYGYWPKQPSEQVEQNRILAIREWKYKLPLPPKSL